MSHRVLPSRARPSRRLLRRDQSGAALLEFVLVAIPFFFILYGLITLGMALAVKQSVTSAAAEGARAAVGQDAATAVTTAKDTVGQRLNWLGANYQDTDTDATVAACTNGTGLCITVKITLPYKSRHVVPPAPIIDNVTPTMLTTTAVVKIS